MIRLASGALAATFHPDLGMVCSSLTDGDVELLGQRGGLEDWRARGKTFGIPLLHPFINRLSGWGYGDIVFPRDSGLVLVDANNLPNHGLLHGDVGWEVLDASPSSVVAALDFDHPDWLALFPALHRLEVVASLDEGGLEIVTVVRCTGDVPVPLSFGWHPYLQLPGVPMTDWVVGTSVDRRMLLDERGIPTGEIVDDGVAPGPLAGRAFDHAYEDAAGAWFALEGGGRRIKLEFGEGYTHAQLFVEPEKGLLAFEPMTAPVNALRSGAALRFVGPGETFRAGFRVAVTRTSPVAGAAPG